MEQAIHTACVIITVLQFHTSKKLLKLHDSLIVSDHNRLIEKETVLMMAALINAFDLKSRSQGKLIRLTDEHKVVYRAHRLHHHKRQTNWF